MDINSLDDLNNFRSAPQLSKIQKKKIISRVKN